MACECGFSYVVGCVEDEAAHRLLHDEYLNGPVVEGAVDLRVQGEVEGKPLIIVDSSVRPIVRRRFARVARTAQRTMPNFSTGYDGTITAARQTLFLL